ncbi:hypothetical protein Ae201684_009427 [Aphanomyces euteiches]|uniref:Uncharacterized protein n=1 Tax=Aphanomyces euteiches TaxID=100861 RepID=A0A6G0X236_9STRA|nr:hypothetical protein Ae201684_009427 [Aphanomyces euteiches]
MAFAHVMAFVKDEQINARHGDVSLRDEIAEDFRRADKDAVEENFVLPLHLIPYFELSAAICFDFERRELEDLGVDLIHELARRGQDKRALCRVVLLTEKHDRHECLANTSVPDHDNILLPCKLDHLFLVVSKCSHGLARTAPTSRMRLMLPTQVRWSHAIKPFGELKAALRRAHQHGLHQRLSKTSHAN